MKSKTIKKVLNQKFNLWLKSIDDENLKKEIRKDTIITGGCIASMLLKEPVNDYDVYFKTYETALKVAEYYTDKFIQNRKTNKNDIENRIYIDTSDTDVQDKTRIKIVVKSAGIASEEGSEIGYSYFESLPDEEGESYINDLITDEVDLDMTEAHDEYEETQELAQEITDDTFRPVFLSTNAITLSNKIQLVFRFYGEADELHENYDFVHCTNYWLSDTNELVLKQPALEALLARELRYVGSRYPLCSIIRTRKFINRGWTINAGQYLKMAMQLNDMDLKNIDVLSDQLTGVDSSYFVQLLDRVKDAGKVDENNMIDYAYLVEIVDRIF